MSLDTLFHQILVTEQQLTEQTQKFKEVKVAAIRCDEKIKNASEKNEELDEERNKKAQQLSAMQLQFDLMKKCEDQMLKQIEALLCQKNQLRERLAQIKWESKDQERKFLEEISRFNSDFSLPGNRDVVLKSQTHSEILDLQREEDALYTEMDVMSCRNSHMSSMQEEKRALQLSLQDLEDVQTDLDQQLMEAEATTGSLRAERRLVSQKPVGDDTCQRLRTELEMHKDGELELLRDALSSEILLLKSKLDSSQRSDDTGTQVLLGL